VSPSPQREEKSRSAVKARGSTELLAKLIQLSGVVGFFLEWSQPGPAQDSVLVVCVIFVVGVEAAKNVAIHFIDRLFDRDS
jgi:hypothetical protein